MDETYLRNEVSALVDLLVKKNTDYGNSFDKLMEKYGGLAFIIRLSDKLGRLETIFETKQILVEDEGVEDTINDIIGYCLLYKHFCMSKKNAGLNETKEFYDEMTTDKKLTCKDGCDVDNECEKCERNEMKEFHDTVVDDVKINPDDMVADKKNKPYHHRAHRGTI